MSMIENQLNKIRKVAKSVYLATEKEVADDLQATLNQAADTIETLSNMGWISCSERLPEVTKFLISLMHGCLCQNPAALIRKKY